MKDALYIIIFGLFIYFGFATVFGDTALMGSYGASFASYNHKYFGYISYIYIFAFMIPLYVFYKDSEFDIRKLELLISSFLAFFSSLLAQAMIVQNDLRGEIGAGFADFLSPYIGTFGLWTFWLIITSVSLVILVDKNAHEIVDAFLKNIKDMFSKNNTFTLKEIKIESKSRDFTDVAEKKMEQKSNKIIVQEKKVAPIMQETVKEVEEEIDVPTYLRKEEPLKPQPSKIAQHNIIELVQEIKEQKNAIVVEELEENAKLLASIEKGAVEKPKNFTLPSVDFLQKPNNKAHSVDESELDGKIKFLIEKLAHFKIDGDVVRTYAGPVVSTFEFKPAANVKVSRILNLQDDLAMALSAESIRIQAPIPGKDVVGIEIPNATVDTIYLRELLDSKLFKESSSPLTIVLGKDIVGKPFITDLKKLPHLLIAGTTGSGKSVGINAMILSLLYKNSPDQLRLLMIDPKMLEFSIYNDIPHLLTPVITKAKQAIVALNNMVYEMERRYSLMSENRTKNIESYNEKVKKEGGEHLPYIVVIIDELADLMMTSGKDVEYSIARLAQMARASGIHLVVATQRPSVDVVTGLIKANLPSRISYRVGQKVDSKIILDQQGAESLLGKGDMLFTPPGSTGLVRLHAPWSTEEEIEKIVNFIKSQRAPNYDKRFLIEESENSYSSSGDTYEELDPLFDEAKNVILTDRKTSISYLQRKLQIGYNKSARLIEQLENEGILSSPNSKGIRDIL
ncbi:DNA translocase FtsK 4TM domain-containing protein [Sulfurimonas sp.]|uniref:FtsK/SpoIIIE family DNA translocase n=1 Tax=Sulfurimonas sp. TaxID=2022749 RepID=UPI002631DA47|nr:DNA translocase FtsK 4TM domain-containing protein [Sulfurimonas sp.]MDD3856045.1 DNA translocase FtsK 4TM domain-containing protein [Sulfurimonas sp.]